MTDRLSKEGRSKLMARVRTRNTAPELKLRSWLHRRGFRFRLASPKLPGKPDVIFPGRKKVVFVHGCFWHGHACPRGRRPASNADFWEAKIARNMARDKRVIAELKQIGWKAFILWECEIKRDESRLRTLVRFIERA